MPESKPLNSYALGLPPRKIPLENIKSSFDWNPIRKCMGCGIEKEFDPTRPPFICSDRCRCYIEAVSEIKNVWNRVQWSRISRKDADLCVNCKKDLRGATFSRVCGSRCKRKFNKKIKNVESWVDAKLEQLLAKVIR